MGGTGLAREREGKLVGRLERSDYKKNIPPLRLSSRE